MTRLVFVAFLLFLFIGCAALVPDWNTRGRGMHSNPKPEFRAWTNPLWFGHPGEVTIFARVNHSDWHGARLEIRWSTARIVLGPEADLSWVFRGRFPEGRHTFQLRVLLEDEIKAERRVWIRLREKDAGRDWRWP